MQFVVWLINCLSFIATIVIQVKFKVYGVKKE